MAPYENARSEAPLRRTQVSESLDNLDHATGELQAIANDLSNRLDGVVRQELTKNETAAGVPKSVRVGLSEAIDERTYRIVSATARLRDLLERIEL
jgi:hypothetical protein